MPKYKVRSTIIHIEKFYILQPISDQTPLSFTTNTTQRNQLTWFWHFSNLAQGWTILAYLQATQYQYNTGPLQAQYCIGIGIGIMFS